MLTEIKPPGPAQVVEVGAALQAILTLGLSSALVMDCGYTETLVLPVSFAMENCDVTQQKQNVFAWAMFSHPLKVARFVKAYEPACIAFC